GLSHQASYLSSLTPRPARRSALGEFILHKYAPVEQAAGFHFKPYDTFIHTPVIREEIRSAKVMDAGHFTVYLPAIGDVQLLKQLSVFPEIRWHVFSRYTDKVYKKGNVSVFPVQNDVFIQSFTSCTGIFTSAGFETPAEALFMGKKLLVTPIQGQYEQQCNAVSLKEMGIPVIKRFNTRVLEELNRWIYSQLPIQVSFPDNLSEVIYMLMEKNCMIPLPRSLQSPLMLSLSSK
ncbi:MAG: glycosyltransferase family protein, partial [Bacteroidota bacterium]